MKMNEFEAIKHAYRLYETWVSGDKQINLRRVEASIKQERRYREANPQTCSAGCLTNIRNDHRLLGFIRNNFSDLFNGTGCYNKTGSN